jgi:hypothetical protein
VLRRTQIPGVLVQIDAAEVVQVVKDAVEHLPGDQIRLIVLFFLLAHALTSLVGMESTAQPHFSALRN